MPEVAHLDGAPASGLPVEMEVTCDHREHAK